MTDFEQLEKQAINLAITNNWQQAILLNKNIIKIDKKNIDAHLRLGFAYLQTSQFDLAKKIYRRALKLLPNNRAATDNLERIKVLESKKQLKKEHINLDPFLFLDTPGKTITVSLVNCGQKNSLARLSIGQPIILFIKKRRVEVRTQNQEYLGCLPDDLSKRMILFIKANSTYEGYIKETSLKHTVVFLKEISKGRKVTKYKSFPTNIQANLDNISDSNEAADNNEATDDESSDLEIEKMAETLTEEKIYLPYQQDSEDESEEE